METEGGTEREKRVKNYARNATNKTPHRTLHTKMSLPQLFGLLPAGSPLIVEPTSLDTSTSSIIYRVPVQPDHPFAHLAIFLLPGANPPLPPGKAASVYISLTGPHAGPESFQVVGGIGPGKESGIFKVAGTATQPVDGVVLVGIAIEDEGVVARRVEEKKMAVGPLQATGQAAANGGGINAGGVLVRPCGGEGGVEGVTTLQLAQRIITNAFNHLASHGQQLNGVEIIPLKAFQDWWRKFEARIRSDPTFLERPQN